MAIEATVQIAELKGVQKPSILNFEGQDVRFEAALIIPEGNSGVEVLIGLRRPRLGNSTSHYSLHEFTVTSVIQSGEGDVSTEHAHGIVGLRLQASGNYSL